MDAFQINHALNMQFNRYDYRLNNSFIFSWESDFLCQSSGGYWVECEVKISRADFFRDFDKPKHRLFKRLKAAKTHFVEDLGSGHGDLICQYKYGELRQGGDYGRRHNNRWGRWVNECNDVWIQQKNEYIYAPATRIRITPIAGIHCPHQFYFTVPEGLVDLDEVPDYAGLIEIADGYATIMKRAPYIHKGKMDLTRQLLKKYYNLWRFRSGGDMEKYYDCIKVKLL